MSEHKCNFRKVCGLQDKDGSHIKIICTECYSEGIFVDGDENTVLYFDEDGNKTPICPGLKYIEERDKNANKGELAKMQIRKGSVVRTEFITGVITKYPSNEALLITDPSESPSYPPTTIKKSDIIEVITY
jgi:hypothetical protein